MNAKTLLRIFGALLGLFALGLQYYLIIKAAGISGKSYISESIRFISFMTIWSNIVVTLAFLIPLISPVSKAGRYFQLPSVESAVMLYIFVVMLVYHFFLAPVWDPQGWQKVVDISLHYAVPITYILYWFIFSSKQNIQYSHAVTWLIYPVAYVIYSMIRGAITNEYPYYFADAHQLGYPIALRNMVFVLLAYFVIGLLVIVFARLFTKSSSRAAIK